MLLGSAYDSDQEEEKEEPALMTAKPKAVAKPGDAVPAPEVQETPRQAERRISVQKLRELTNEINAAKSATAVVQVVRRCIDTSWDLRWGAPALYQIAKRSTARTRKEWAADPLVKKLADKLRHEADTGEVLVGKRPDDLDVLLVALEALRRMGLQEPEAQLGALERAVKLLVAASFRHPVKSMVRLFWLGAHLKLEGQLAEQTSLLPTEIRARSGDLDGPDLALLLAAMRKKGEAPGARDSGLLDKAVLRLKSKGVHEGLTATDLVEMAEGLLEIAVTDEGALRPLGQEVLRRRGELTPDESHRVHTAYQAMKLPLPKVWTEPGASKKRDGSQIVTTQAFRPQDGHEKKRRGNNDVERTSPPRVVRDYKMMSY